MKCLVVDDAGHPASRIEGRMMAMDPGARREELLSDSEATLRQVQGVLAEFSSVEITSVIGCLRQSSGKPEQESIEWLLMDIEDRLVELARVFDAPNGQALADRPRR